MQDTAPRLIIVGGGVIGLSAAYYALRDGHQVTVLEREPADTANCSSGNAGMIVPSHFIPLAAPGILSKGLRWMLDKESPFYVRPRLSPELMRWGWLFCRHATHAHTQALRNTLCALNLESRRLFQELAQEDDFGLTTRGLLMLCKHQETLDEEAAVATQARELGLKAEVIDAATAARIDPNIEMDIVGAIHFGDDCHLDPQRFLSLLRRRITEMGGTIVYNSPVDHIETKNGKIIAVQGAGGRFEADRFIIAGGTWTTGLMRQIGLRLPMQAGKGYSLTLPAPPQLPNLCSILTEAKVAITPMGNSLRVAGTMEIGGINHDINPNRVRGIIKSVQRYFPRFSDADFDNIDPWVGLRPVSPDGIPYLGKVPGLSNLVVASGHAMMGLSLAPVTGKLVADLLANRPTLPAIDRLDVARFA